MWKALGLAVVLVAALAGSALAGGGYVALKAGAADVVYEDIKIGNFKINGSDNDWVFSGGAAVGFDWYEEQGIPLRTELEYLYRDDYEYSDSVTSGADSFNAKVTSNIQTMFANVYYDFLRDQPINVYLGAGLGLAIIDSKLSSTLTYNGVTYNAGYDSSVTNFAWNVGAGAVYHFTEHWAADLNYRFEGVGEAKIDVGNDKITGDGYVHNILLGVRYTF